MNADEQYDSYCAAPSGQTVLTYRLLACHRRRLLGEYRTHGDHLLTTPQWLGGYSVAMASRTGIREARSAGHRAAMTPTTTESTSMPTIWPQGMLRLVSP